MRELVVSPDMNRGQMGVGADRSSDQMRVGVDQMETGTTWRQQNRWKLPIWYPIPLISYLFFTISYFGNV